MTALLAAFAPFLVNGLTSGIKRFRGLAKEHSWMSEGPRRRILQLLAAVFSFLGVLGYAFLNGEEVDPASINTLVDTFLTFLASQGSYFLAKRKEA